MSKRTLRNRFPDKAALFHAAIRRAIARVAVPQTALWASTSDDLDQTLLATARLLADGAAAAPARQLRRLLFAEADRFPELAREARRHDVAPVVDFVAELLRRHAERGTVRVDRPERAAAAFLATVLDVAATGEPANPDVRYCVDLFLCGVRRR